MSETTKAGGCDQGTSRLLQQLHACGIVHLDHCIEELLAPAPVDANGAGGAQSKGAQGLSAEIKGADVIKGAEATPEAPGMVETIRAAAAHRDLG